jgi:pimeloyl-ACP methyl ester carboxylesterase
VQPARRSTRQPTGSRFVLVPGGWHGGWVYDEVAARLRERGHHALPLTLTGLGERAHLLTSSTNLDTHIQDVVGVVESERIEDVVLCGHSYGGLVIAGVADRIPGRVAALVHIDAYVPADGDSCWSLTTQAFRDLFIRGAGSDGHSVAPPPGLDPRATPHPLASFVQRIRLGGAHERIARREFVYLSGWRGTPFAATYERLRRDPAWRVHTLHTGHDVMTQAPDRLVDILVAVSPTARER